MRKLFLNLFILTILFSLTGSLQAQAQTTSPSPVKFRSLEVDFWPEYDQPEMLVIYRAELDPSVSLPTDLTIRVPARVGMPHAVATGQTNASLFNVTPTRQVDGDWALITFNTAVPIVRLEYYDPALDVSKEQRIYQYSWPGDYAVDQLMLQVQQPCDASNMQISPSLGTGTMGSDGLVYYNGSFGPLSQNQTFDLTMSYQKASDCLSINTLNIGSELPENTPGRTTLMSILPYLLGLVGVLLIGGGILWYWMSGRQRETVSASRRGRRQNRQATYSEPSREVRAGPEVDVSDGAIYCHQCGKRANPSDKFCRSCGARLRSG
jgi:hypothetical protein